MAEAFIGQITAFGFNYAPENWAPCNGQSMAIAQYTALFSLLGTTYGGDGTHTFNLPNLNGSVPVGMGVSSASGAAYPLGAVGGDAAVSLSTASVPSHSHVLSVNSGTATASTPEANVAPGAGTASGTSHGHSSTVALGFYASTSGSPATMAPQAVSTLAGGGTPHSNIQPTLVGNWCICVEGIFPTRS